MGSQADGVDFDVEKLRRYLWDYLVPILPANGGVASGDGVSATWLSGGGYEGFDGFSIKLKKFKVCVQKQ